MVSVNFDNMQIGTIIKYTYFNLVLLCILVLYYSAEWLKLPSHKRHPIQKGKKWKNIAINNVCVVAGLLPLKC